jgi:hypothetical protein
MKNKPLRIVLCIILVIVYFGIISSVAILEISNAQSKENQVELVQEENMTVGEIESSEDEEISTLDYISSTDEQDEKSDNKNLVKSIEEYESAIRNPLSNEYKSLMNDITTSEKEKLEEEANAKHEIVNGLIAIIVMILIMIYCFNHQGYDENSHFEDDG